MKIENKRGGAIIDIIAPPVFTLGIILCAWAGYLYFDNGKKTHYIEELEKKINALKNQTNVVEKRIEEINNLVGLKMLTEQDRNSLKEEVEKEKKIFLEGEEKEGGKREKGITTVKNVLANKYLPDKVESYLLAKVWLQKKLTEAREKVKTLTNNQIKIMDKIEAKFKELYPTIKYDKDLFFQNYPSYINVILTLDSLANLLYNFREEKKRKNANIEFLIKKFENYYAFLNNFETENIRKFSTIESSNLKEVCEYIKAVYDKQMKINNYINEKVKRINEITKSIEDENKMLDSEVNKLRNNLDALRVVGTLKKDIFNYGGTIIREDFSSKIVFTSYGSKDGLQKGHIFYVFDFFPIGGYRWKGLIEIIEVEDTRSKARILQENFATNPIRTGDYLASPFFKSGSKIRVYIYGRVEKTTFGFSEEELREHLESLGIIVQRDIYDEKKKVVANGFDLYTDFVIKGQDKIGVDIRTDRQWKEIIELGIPVISLYELLPLLGTYIKTMK